MAHDGQDIAMAQPILLDDLLTLTGAALAPAETLLERAKDKVRAAVTVDGRISATAMDAGQSATHGLAWLATYVESLRQMQGWAARLSEAGTFGEVERLLHDRLTSKRSPARAHAARERLSRALLLPCFC